EDWQPDITLGDLKAAIIAKWPEVTTSVAHASRAASDEKDEFDWTQRAKAEWNPFDDATTIQHLSNPKYANDRSAGAFRFINLAKRRGYTPEQIVTVMLENPTCLVMGHYADADGKGGQEVSEDRVRADVKRVFTKAEKPLRGSTGAGVFRVHPRDGENTARL